MGGNRSTWREAMQTWVEHANATQKTLDYRIFLLVTVLITVSAMLAQKVDSVHLELFQ